MSTHSTVILALFVPGYLLAIPTTAFLAKRGLFIGTKLDRICFPGGEEGSGAYAKEREILNSVGVHASETPVDLWLSGVAIALGYGLVLLVWDRYLAWEQYLQPGVAIETTETQLKSNFILQVSVFTVAFLVAALRRGRTGRL
jgi:hypothetical protein